MAAHKQRTRGASSSKQPLINEQLDTTQVTGDDVGSVQPDDNVAP